jgi:transcriptional regulator
MYIPKHFRQNDEAEILRFLKSNNFGVLLSSSNDLITGTHLPFIINETGNNTFSLTSHLAAANPQLKNWTIKSEALVIFSGPHGYVSPALYEDKQNVPTWNYVAVHVYGNITIVQDFEAKKSILERSIAEFEAAYFEQWKSLDNQYRDKLINGMTGLEMQVTKVEAKYKLSQNKPESTRENVAKHFRDMGNDLGDYMRKVE